MGRASTPPIFSLLNFTTMEKELNNKLLLSEQTRNRLSEYIEHGEDFVIYFYNGGNYWYLAVTMDYEADMVAIELYDCEYDKNWQDWRAGCNEETIFDIIEDDTPMTGEISNEIPISTKIFNKMIR